MNINKDLAYEICKELGVQWNEDFLYPMMNEKTIEEKDIDKLFDKNVDNLTNL